MPCSNLGPTYYPKTAEHGLSLASSAGDGYSIRVEWYQATPTATNLSIGYNIYYSTSQDLVFSEGPKLVVGNDSPRSIFIYDFFPGQTYFFAVRAFEYSASWYNVENLPLYTRPNLPDFPIITNEIPIHYYPSSVLTSNIDDETLIIPVDDVEIFPNFGVIQIGYELIAYSNKSLVNGTLNASERGFLGSSPRIHQVDGFDGYVYHSPIFNFWKGSEEANYFIEQVQSIFKQGYEVFTVDDGYKQINKNNILTRDLSIQEEDRKDYPSFDYTGWHRTKLTDVINGVCLDSYIGGEWGCADGYGIDNQIRGIPATDLADQRAEQKLEMSGEPVILLRRQMAGIIHPSYEINKEFPEPREPYGFGTELQTGYEQFYNPRRSDRRILVRFGVTDEDLVLTDSGQELKIDYSCEAISTPIIKDQDVIIRFLDPPNYTIEEARYEVVSVKRGSFVYGATGYQTFNVKRIPKTSEVYKWAANKGYGFFPSEVSTTIGLLRGANGTFIPHVHTIVVNENVTSVNQLNQTTNYVEGHNHVVRNGIVLPAVGPDGKGHTHSVII